MPSQLHSPSAPAPTPYITSTDSSRAPFSCESQILPLNFSHADPHADRPTKTNPQPFTDLLLDFDADAWHRYVNHPFPNGLGAGTLPLKCFLHFIQQDYHYLKVSAAFRFLQDERQSLTPRARQQYGRANALAAYKTEDMGEMAASMEITNTVIKETEIHVKVRPIPFPPVLLHPAPDSRASPSIARSTASREKRSSPSPKA